MLIRDVENLQRVKGIVEGRDSLRRESQGIEEQVVMGGDSMCVQKHKLIKTLVALINNILCNE